MTEAKTVCRIVITGCSGGGKSTLLAELARRGFAVVEEPGRRVVKDELEKDGTALPWIDPIAFLRRAFEVGLEDWNLSRRLPGPVFFDRGLVDAASALAHLTGEKMALDLSTRYCRRVFMAPPWPEIYQPDDERRHGFDQALQEYERLLVSYPSLGYEICALPKIAAPQRADFLLSNL
jgi:predicted ATPase